MIKKILFAVTCVFLFAACDSSVTAFKVGGTDAGNLEKKKSGEISYWKFDSMQQESVSKFFNFENDGALYAELEIRAKGSKENVELGFLYPDDFTSSGSINELKGRPVLFFRAEEFDGTTTGFFFSFNREASAPCGFWIKSGRAGVKLCAASVERGAIGFDYSEEKQLYACAPNGGLIKRNSYSMDLSGASFAFDSVNSMASVSLIPQMTVYFTKNAPSDRIVKFSFGGEKLSVNPSENGVTIPLSAFKNPFVDVSVIENAQLVKSAVVFASDKSIMIPVNHDFVPLTAYPVDPGLIIKWPKKNWRGRDYELFVWDRFPHILIMDTGFYSYQDKMFKRIAFYVEKQGYKGKLWGDDVIGDLHGYNAHDYQAKDLARFFEEARRTNFPLNDEELLLKKILIRNGVLVDEGDGKVSAGLGAILSISQSTPVQIRTQLLAHEGWHGIFFEDEEFRNAVGAIYNTLYAMDQRSLDFMKEYFKYAPGLGYDLDDDFLMKTEFMSYLLQFDLSKVQEKWVYYAKRPYMREKSPELSEYIIRTNGEGLLSADQMMNDYVNQKWGLNAGRIWMATTVSEND